MNQNNVCFVIISILDVGYKFQPYVCNGFYAVSMMAYELKKIAI